MTTGRINQVTSLKKKRENQVETALEKSGLRSISFRSFFRRQSSQENVAILPKRPGQEVVSSLICLCETCTTSA